MVQFGKKLEDLKLEQWDRYYMDYKALKKQLKILDAQYAQSSPNSRMRGVDNFKHALDVEVRWITSSNDTKVTLHID